MKQMTSRKAGSIRIAVIAALVAILGFSFAGPASAQTIHTATAHRTSAKPTPHIITLAGTNGCASIRYKNVWRGTACFRATGDKFYVRDNAADGYHVELRGLGNWGNPTTGYKCIDTAGKAAGWTVCDGWSGIIPEHGTLVLWVTVVNGSTVLASQQWVGHPAG